MRERTVQILLTLLILIVLQAGVAGKALCDDGKEETHFKNEGKNPGIEEALPPDKMAETEHVLGTGTSALRYRAMAGTLPIEITGERECRIFFISYELQDEPHDSRPLTFVFNGGPGASSAYLHLAALGPMRVVFHKDGSIPAPPARLTENMHTWLRFTDLVFVDPVGTGYSRCVSTPSDGKNEEKGKKETGVWGVQEDLTSLAKFIRLYLTRNDRWLCPKFLVGESYGGFRVAALSELLTSDYGICPNGIVLLSPVLEFGYIMGDDFSLLPWIVTLPSYAATAMYHKKAVGKRPESGDRRADLKEVEDFAVKVFLPALAEARTSEIEHRIDSYTGLPEPFVSRLQCRISPRLFVKELLRQDGRLISIYDGTWKAIDPDPASPLPPEKDLLLVDVNTLVTAGFNSYVREELKFKTDIPYEVLNNQVSRKWNWRSGLDSGQGFAGVAGDIKSSMSMNKDLKVFIAHGVFDLVTPYFGSVLITRQMSLDPAIASNLKLKVYEGGHMFYTHRQGRLDFFEDAKEFFGSTPASALLPIE